ncbi:hypothetical protein Tco_1013668 [Tanacetum coccineum]
MRWSEVNVDSNDSWIWKALLSLREKARKHIEYKIGNGEWISVWHDKWYGSILNILQGRNELLEKIIGCVVDSGGVPELDLKVLGIWGLFGIA